MGNSVLTVIFDDTANPEQVRESKIFNNADFILIDILNPVLAENEGLEIGLALLGNIPIIGKTVVKYIPFRISEYTIGNTGDSKELIAIPREFSESITEMFVAINCSISVTLRIYVIGRGSITNDLENDTNITVHDILERVKRLEITEAIANTAIIGLEITEIASLAIIGTEVTVLLAEVNAIPLLLAAAL